MSRLYDRFAQAYFEWNDDGTIRKFDAAGCAHCRKIMVRDPGVGKPNDYAYDYRCAKCGYRHICKQCAQEMAANGDRCIPFEKSLQKLEMVCSSYADEHRYPKLDREQAILLATR